jgi:hypothetical protein
MNAEARITAYTVSRLPDDCPDSDTWSVRVEATGFGRWAVRWFARCLTRDGEWEWEPQPSSRDDEFLARCRFPDLESALKAATEVEPGLTVNGLTSEDVARRWADRASV